MTSWIKPLLSILFAVPWVAEGPTGWGIIDGKVGLAHRTSLATVLAVKSRSEMQRSEDECSGGTWGSVAVGWLPAGLLLGGGIGKAAVQGTTTLRPQRARFWSFD